MYVFLYVKCIYITCTYIRCSAFYIYILVDCPKTIFNLKNFHKYYPQCRSSVQIARVARFSAYIVIISYESSRINNSQLKYFLFQLRHVLN